MKKGQKPNANEKQLREAAHRGMDRTMVFCLTALADKCGFSREQLIDFCIGCPMARKHGREKEFLRWPKYKSNYILTFDRMLDERRRRKLDSSWRLQTGIDVFNWWMEYDIIPGQMDLFED